MCPAASAGVRAGARCAKPPLRSVSQPPSRAREFADELARTNVGVGCDDLPEEPEVRLGRFSSAMGFESGLDSETFPDTEGYGFPRRDMRVSHRKLA